jgi:hypothetical protein
MLLMVFNGFIKEASAQTNVPEKKPSVVSFFSAAVGSAPLFLDWGGQKAFPEGLKTGQAVGPLLVPSGSFPIRYQMEGFLDGQGKADALTEKICTFVFYSGPPLKDGKDAGKRPLKVFPIPPVSEGESRKEYQWLVIYLGVTESVEIEANKQKVKLKNADPIFLGKGERFFEITQAGKSLASVTVDSPDNHIFVIYGDDPKSLSAGIVYR